MSGHFKKTIRILIVVIAVLIVGGYAYFRTSGFVRGPVVTITSPENGSVLERALTDVSGIAKNISHIALNGRQIFVDEAGIFREQVLLSEGINTLQVAVNDRFGREKDEVVSIVYKPN